MTSLELAEIAYFHRDASSTGGRYLVWCDDGEGYVMEDGALWDPWTRTTLERPVSPPVLVFDERSVWYPLMGRDDRTKDNGLAKAVRRLGGHDGQPTVAPEERSIVEQLRDVTRLVEDRQHRLAALAAVRAGGWRFHPYFEGWKGLVPASDFDWDISRHLCIVREFDLWANRVSPATTHLSAAAGEGSIEERLRRLSREHLVRTGVVREAEARGWKPAWRLESWGHLWPCGLMEHTIDDAFRSRTGHCVSQAHMTAAVLEELDVPHIVVNFDRGGVTEGVNHHFVLSRDGTFLFDDGIVNFRGIDPQTEDYGPLLSFSAEGEWARTVGDGLVGNIPSERIAEWIDVIDRAVAGRFELRFYEVQHEKTTVDKGEFRSLLEARETELVAIP